MSDVKMSLGQLARLAADIREDKRKLDKESKEMGARLDEIKGLIYAQLDEQGVDRTAVDGISISKSDTVVPTVTDWEKVEEYITQTNQLHLYQRRLSATLWREMMESGELVPGTEPFTKRDVNLRVTK